VNAESSGNKVTEKIPVWEFIDSGFQAARYNMDYDLKLVEECGRTGKSFLRFYRWKPYAISLGYNQNKSLSALNINEGKCNADGIDIVTRPTGGRAVFHAEELTYSVVFKTKRGVRELYRDISMAVLDGLKTIDLKMCELSFSKETPDLLKLIKTGMYNLCFNSQVKYEINHRGKKLVGSAQRKFGEVMLQHGSILIGSRHRDIADYLNISGEERIRMKNEIDEKTTCLNSIAGRIVSYDEASKAVFEGFTRGFNIQFSKINRLASHFSGKEAEPVLN
jgi:lipoate-protein ligase A